MENIRVLIVDDLPHVRQGLKTVLTLSSKNMKVGIKVIGEAQNGKEAILQADLLHPDVILMDLEMPLLDGCAATRSIKRISPSVGIIILTIHGDPVSRQQAHQAGADAFLEKGAPLDELIQVIQKCRITS